MQKIKTIGIILLLFGLAASYMAILATPTVAAKYISPDYSQSTLLIFQLQVFRRLLAGMGALLMIVGAIFIITQETKLRAIFDWLIGKLKSEQILAGIIIAGGCTVRLFHLLIWGTESPYYYGGLFLEFSDQIAANGWLLPENIPFYTNGGIPFAYPPLPFYIEAIAIKLLGFTPFAVVNILPSFIAILTLPSFYILARVVGLKQWARLIALLAFAFMPNAFIDQIEGGGLAESFGTLALTWFLVSLFYTLKNEHSSQYKNYFLIGISWAFCVISSPGSAYASTLCFLVFSIVVLLRGNFTHAILRLALAGVTALVISSPYWISVVNNHGIRLFVESFSGQHTDFLKDSFVRVLNFQIVKGQYIFIWNFLILVGVVFGFIERRFYLLILFLLFTIFPRENAWLVSIPSALLVGIGAEGIVNFVRHTLGMGVNKAPVIGLGLLMALWFAIGPLTSIATSTFSAPSSLDAEIVAAMQWLRMNTQPESKVIAITERHVKEWLPQISQRTVINMPFGAEWQPEEGYLISRMGDVLSECQDLDCVFSSGQIILDIDQFLLFADRNKLSTLAQKHTSKTEFHLLWENEKTSIGMLCRVDTCP